MLNELALSMRVLAVTKIFPNSLEPLSSPFNRQQFKALARKCSLTVLEAIPHFPGASITGVPLRAAKLAKLPEREMNDGIETIFMRQLYVPKVGVPIAVPLYLASLAPYRAMAREFDVIFATWAYPDACAAILFAGALGKPCVFKVHGSDMNVIAKRPSARLVIGRVLRFADAAVAVSRPLSEELAVLGVPRERIHVVANGADTKLFAPRDKKEARRKLGIAEDGPLVLFCGRLEPQKGLVELLEAFALLRRNVPGARLALLGDGVMRVEVDAKAREHEGALFAPGARPHAEIAEWMAACDVFTLPSHNEGTPNVVLEALASGRPAVGSRVGGIPEVLADPRSGLLVPVRDACALADALAAALARRWDPREVRATGPGSWEESGDRLYDVLRSVTAT